MSGHHPWTAIRRRSQMQGPELLLHVRARLEQTLAELLPRTKMPVSDVLLLLAEIDDDEVIPLMEHYGVYNCVVCHTWDNKLWINLPERVCEPCWNAWRETHPPVEDVATGDHL